MNGRLFVLGSFVMACCTRVARLPCAGESLVAESFSAEPGGKGFNVAAAASRLGAHVDCLAVVGDDVFGGLAESAFVSVGLSPAFLRRAAGAATGAGIGFIAKDGENCLAVCPGANTLLCAEDVRRHAASIEAAALTIATFELADDPILSAFTLARGAGRRTLLNPSPFRPPSAEILAVTSILVVNQSEAHALAGSRGLTLADAASGSIRLLAEALFGAGVDMLVVTLGSAGAVAVTRDRLVRQTPFPVTAIDTLGAGDAFVAGMAAALAAGASFDTALRRAGAAGALMATRPGTFAALPTRAEVDGLDGSIPSQINALHLPG